MTIVRTKHPKFSCTESKTCKSLKSDILWLVVFLLFLQAPSGECGYKFTADNNVAEVVDQDRCQSWFRVAAASHLTPPFSLLFCKSDPRFCRCWTFGCHSCLHKNNNNTQKNTRDLHDAHFRSLPTLFCVSLSCVCDWLFKFDWLSKANKGHSRISRCACSDGRECTQKAFPRQSACVWKRFWIGMASVKALFIPLCLQLTKRRSLIYIYSKRKEKKHSNLLGARPPLYLPSTFQQRSRGSEAAQTRKRAGGRDRSESEGRRA